MGKGKQVAERLRWSAVLAGFFITAVCALGVRPLSAHVGLQLKAGPVDMLTMLSILAGAFAAGRLAGNIEGIHGATVAVLYILVIYVGGEVLGEIHLARIVGLQGLGKLEKWSNLGRDFFYFIAGALGGLWATPFNAREHRRTNDLLRTAVTLSRPKPKQKEVGKSGSREDERFDPESPSDSPTASTSRLPDSGQSPRLS